MFFESKQILALVIIYISIYSYLQNRKLHLTLDQTREQSRLFGSGGRGEDTVREP